MLGVFWWVLLDEMMIVERVKVKLVVGKVVVMLLLFNKLERREVKLKNRKHVHATAEY